MDDSRLSRIDTRWSIVRRAGAGEPDQVRIAQQELLDRYGGAIRRYLVASLRDADAADEVFQEFSLAFLRRGFEQANPERGRFRSFVKTTLFHLIVDYRRRRGRRAVERPLETEMAEQAAEPAPLAEQDRMLTESWREDLLARAWEELHKLEVTSGKPYFTLLRFRVDHPDLHSGDMGAKMAAVLGKTLSAGAVRVLLHRARSEFAEQLLDAVVDSLDGADWDEVEQELIELDLLRYCRPALECRSSKSPDGAKTPG